MDVAVTPPAWGIASVASTKNPTRRALEPSSNRIPSHDRTNAKDARTPPNGNDEESVTLALAMKPAVTEQPHLGTSIRGQNHAMKPA